MGKNINLKTDHEFAKSRIVLPSRRKELTMLGKGGKPNACRALEVKRLYENIFFGFSNPTTLVRTMWWTITTCFGYRARGESRKLKFGDITLNIDFHGKEYLEWEKERGTKTRTGESSYSHQRAYNPRAYAIAGPKCPVKTDKNFVRHRPI